MTNPIIEPERLCVWREARSEGHAGMEAVWCVILNRARKHRMTPAQVVMVPWAFSSMTAHGDPQLGLYPKPDDREMEYIDTLHLVWLDTTHGSTLYYDDSIEFPKSWNPKHTQATVKIGRLNFFREI